ncbi:DUF2231 domain-containing protein [[Flexibacter] sp. ATCC 35208]|uniref:DUF2231 domain-containing protein n=1 Tax=[Flexibacter] sp. ATCC 35208 TaxID=1936242 RepID=UPI0009C9CFA6|nr:DUF2231 domain-containing protein [[Flexibacter] sp. ATCC 35208]OMP74785.1 hypothetical protein BW716_33515 [[Flexibacter] sp. ATCC 35208]
MISPTHLHAMVVHFPIALLLVGFLFEVIGFFYKKVFFRQSAFYLLILGTLGTVVSYLAGNAAGEGLEEGPLNKAMELHEQAATIALWLTIITSAVYLCIHFFKYYKSWARIISVILFACVIAAISRTGYLGGELVYKHGAGVELALPDFSNPDAK